jgi:hypothetical protein
MPGDEPLREDHALFDQKPGKGLELNPFVYQRVP